MLRMPLQQGLRRLIVLAAPILLVLGCASPELQGPGLGAGHPRLGAVAAVATDGYRLPVRRWGDAARPRALVLALHGFNDYGNAFAALGGYLSQRGIVTYSYDQRGFGATDQRGRWVGERQMTSDLETLRRLLTSRYPGVPLYVLGESMGGAVVMAAAGLGERVDGIVLVAPAVWSRDTMNPILRLVLAAAAHSVPWLKLTGDGLDIRPSDNQEMLRAFHADPLVIKGTRVDALWGVTNMMDLAMAQTSKLSPPVLLLYGAHDEIVPKGAFCAMLKRLPDASGGIRVVLYRKGWHMLMRDLQGDRVMADIAAWLSSQQAPLPSGEEIEAGSERLRDFCGDEAKSTPIARRAEGKQTQMGLRETGPAW